MKKIILALLLTALMAVGMQPTKTSTPKSVPVPKQPVVQKTLSNIKPTPQPVPAPEAPIVPAVAPQPQTPLAYMNAAGIAPSDQGFVDYIISHESGWNPDATEPTSGAHGLPQALPYSKTGCGWDDGVCQLQWAQNYAIARYGSWAAAYSYWLLHHNW